jgi:hypothetical protein
MAQSWVASESITRLPQEEGSPIPRAGCLAYNPHSLAVVTELFIEFNRRK